MRRRVTEHILLSFESTRKENSLVCADVPGTNLHFEAPFRHKTNAAEFKITWCCESPALGLSSTHHQHVWEASARQPSPLWRKWETFISTDAPKAMVGHSYNYFWRKSRDKIRAYKWSRVGAYVKRHTVSVQVRSVAFEAEMDKNRCRHTQGRLSHLSYYIVSS